MPRLRRGKRRKRRFLWAVDLNLRSLRYLLFKIFRRRFCYRENTVSHRFAPARRSMRRLGVSWAEKEKTQSRNAESAINHLSRRSCAKADWWLRALRCGEADDLLFASDGERALCRRQKSFLDVF